MSLTCNTPLTSTVPHHIVAKVSNQTVATVLLVENSRAMSYIWSDLQDQYLNKLIDNIATADQFVPVCDGLLIYHLFITFVLSS